MFLHMLNTLPHFLAYFFTALGLFLVFITAFSASTPHREFALIRDGNRSAAIQMIGTVLGFALPLAVILGHAVSLPDLLAWGLVALVVQIITFWVIQFVFKNISDKIVNNCVSSGIFVGGMAFAVGMIQAGCMVP
jgi:putative membrane protein